MNIYPNIIPSEIKNIPKEKKQKEKIPKALREQVWIQKIGKKFNTKCPIRWCKNRITPFDFHVGHNIPETKGGTLDINNLKPICARCNLSMGSQYTINEWQTLAKPVNKCCIIM
jgi:5-methylcytosine-specific restriction endonuclease McrA